MNFATLKGLTIPEGVVKELAVNGQKVWRSKPKEIFYSKLIDRSIAGITSNATSVRASAFNSCKALTTADFPVATNIRSSAFAGCSALTALILRSETRATLEAGAALTGTPIASGTGYIYVPRALVDSYKVASSWSTYANRFRAIEDYPDICGGESA